MRSVAKFGALSAVAVLSLSIPAYAEGADISADLAFMPNTTNVTLLNESGKFVTVDMKKIAKGEKCRMEKDAIIMKVGPGASPNTTRVRYIAPNLAHGGCPFRTEFELSNADYSTARSTFTTRKDEASKKVEALKKQLGSKWNELSGDKH